MQEIPTYVDNQVECIIHVMWLKGPNIYELEDFLATGRDMKVGGLMEDVNLKVIEEPVVDNVTRYTQEPQEPDSNYTDH